MPLQETGGEGTLDSEKSDAQLVGRGSQKVLEAAGLWGDDENEALMEIEQDRVTQRSLIADFRDFFVNEVRLCSFGIPSKHSATECCEHRPMARMPTGARDSFGGQGPCLVELEESMESIEVSFVACGAGDDRANGQWRQDGMYEGRQSFCRIVDRRVVIRWSGEAKEWRLGSRNMSEEGAFYRMPDPEQQTDLPLNGWEPVGQSMPPVMQVQSSFDYFEVFDRGWKARPPKFSKSLGLSRFSNPRWSEISGPYGESVVSWLWFLQSHDHHHQNLIGAYKSTIVGILTAAPALAGRVMNKQPYLGETILHQACAAGHVEMVDWLVNNPNIRREDFFHSEFLEGRLNGSFLTDVLKRPERFAGMVELVMPPDADQRYNGSTPLMVAMLAPHTDQACIDIVKLLLRAGAQPIYYDSKTTKIRFSILHVIAASSWWDGWDEAPLMSKARMRRLLSLFLDSHAVFHHQGREMVSLANANNYTPLHVTAMFGNEDGFIGLLEHMIVPVWEWGKKKEVGFPLRELDSAAREDEIAALELMTLYKHGNLLTLGIITEIIDRKWSIFGDRWARRFVLMQLLGCVCTAIVCLDDTAGYSNTRWVAKHIVLTLSCGFVLFSVLLYVLCARNECWFQHMDPSFWWPKGDRINVFNLLASRNVVEMSMMGLLVITPPWYAYPELRKLPYYDFCWHSFASAWFLMFILFMLRYFELWRATSAMASTLPTVIWKDMIPFGSFYFVILICFAISMRISVEVPGSEQADNAFGSFKNTLWTMEEAIHGPDVQWRNAVEHHPMVAGFIFVSFLWITLVMMSILIAMFGTTWEGLKEHVNERFLFRRAMFCITLEKLFPQWYHEHSSWGPSGCNIGHPLGFNGPSGGAESDSDSEGEASADVDVEASEHAHILRPKKLMAQEVAKAQEIAKLNDRWLLWNGGEHTFDRWKHDTVHDPKPHL